MTAPLPLPVSPTSHPALLPVAHRRRLREVWRSAGWPCRDTVEVELLAAGLLARRFDGEGRETLHLTDAGIGALAATLARNRAAFDAHEALVARVAEQMQRAGRIVWRGLSLRAPLPALAQAQAEAQAAAEPRPGAGARPDMRPEQSPGGDLRGTLDMPPDVPMGGVAAGDVTAGDAPARPRWVIAMPDVYSIRHTTVEAFTEPAVHEIKVRRADLLADLRRPDKGAAYLSLSSQCWYVLGPGVGTAEDVPPEFGVWLVTEQGFEVARPAPRRAVRPDFAVWMALARATAERPADVGERAQSPLRGESGTDLAGDDPRWAGR